MPSSYLFLNGMRVHYLSWNQDGAGPEVVLLHGLASNARIWELVAPFLAEAGLIVLAPDLRGHGLTDKPDGDYGFDIFARDLVAFLNAHHITHPILVGHSWGGMLALDFAARFSLGPHAPAGIALVDGGLTQMDDSGATWEVTRRRLTPPRLAGMPLSRFLELLADGDGWHPGEEAIPLILGNFEIDEDETIAPRLAFENHMKILRSMWDFKTFNAFRKVSCPVLMAAALPPEGASRGDEAYRRLKERGVEQARQSIRRLTVHWLPDTVHDIPLQRPHELADQLLEFIRSLGPQAR